MGWMSNWEYAVSVPTTKWRSAMTIPRTLKLRNTPEGLQLFSDPIRELDQLRNKTVQISAQTIEGHLPVEGISSTLSEIALTFDLASAKGKSFGIQMANAKGEYVRISYYQASSLIIIDRTHSGKVDFSPAFAGGLQYIPVKTKNDEMEWQAFFDRSSFELFVDDGAIVITDIYFPNEDFTEMSLFSLDGKTKLKSGTVYELKGTW